MAFAQSCEHQNYQVKEEALGQFAVQLTQALNQLATRADRTRLTEEQKVLSRSSRTITETSTITNAKGCGSLGSSTTCEQLLAIIQTRLSIVKSRWNRPRTPHGVALIERAKWFAQKAREMVGAIVMRLSISQYDVDDLIDRKEQLKA